MKHRMLTPNQQSECLTLLSRGASPAVACRELDVDHDSFFETMRHDAAFRLRVEDMQAMLTGNVSAALYKSALEGKVTAQTFYLRHFARPALEKEREDFSDMPIDDLRDMLLAKLPEAEEQEDAHNGPDRDDRLTK